MSHIGKTIFIDNWQPSTLGIKNHHQFIDSKVVEEWFEPSPDGRTSGKEFVKTEDGRTFWRYDCYASFSPYGFEELKQPAPEES